MLGWSWGSHGRIRPDAGVEWPVRGDLHAVWKTGSLGRRGTSSSGLSGRRARRGIPSPVFAVRSGTSPPRLGRCSMESDLSTLTSDLLSRLPTITGEEQRLGLEIYRQLARGEPVSSPELARALEAPTGTVEELLARPNLKSPPYPAKDGRIIGFAGLA